MKAQSFSTKVAVLSLFLAALFFLTPVHAGLNDKKAIAGAAGKYKGTWSNTTTFDMILSPLPTLKNGKPKIKGSIRLSRRPKKLNFKLPPGIHAPIPGATVTTKMKITKTIVRRCGKLIIHKATGTQDMTAYFGPEADMKGKGQATLKARGSKFMATGKFSGKDATPPVAPPLGFTAVSTKGTFKGKGS